MSETELQKKARLALYDAAIDAAFRKFKNRVASEDTFDEMCEWITKWLKRRKRRALVSWGGTNGRVAFQINDADRDFGEAGKVVNDDGA